MEPDEKLLNKTIARNVLTRLARSHLRETDLPEVAGISEPEAQAVLGGCGAPSHVLYQLARAFNCAADDFFLGIFDEWEPKRSGGSVNGDRLKIIQSLQSHKLLRELGDISNQELRDSIYSMVTGLAGIARFLDLRGLEMCKMAGE